MSFICEDLKPWPPEASGSVSRFGGKFCRNAGTAVLKRPVAVGSGINLFCECNEGPLLLSVSAKDEESAQKIVDLLIRHLGWNLAGLGMLQTP